MSPPRSSSSSSAPSAPPAPLHQRRRFHATVAMSQPGSESDSDDDESRWEAYKSGPHTPSLAETASTLRRSLSMATLQRLAREAEAARSPGPPEDLPPTRRELVRGAARGLGRTLKPKVWRPSDEPAREPGDWERLAVHVLRGGIRAWLVSFGMRGTIFSLFALIRAVRQRPSIPKLVAVGKTYVAPPNVRFANMMGAWALLYKAIFNALRLLTPPPASRPRSRAVSDASQSSDTDSPREKKKHRPRPKHIRDPRSRVWHGYVAGAVSAIAVLLERKDMRISLAQQLLVRGMEGTYNVFESQGLVHIPHGAVLVFGLACGQIMWAWVNAPETLPRGYVSWITKASHAPAPAVPAQQDIAATGVPKLEGLLSFFPNGKLPAKVGGEFPAVAPNSVNLAGVSPRNVSKISDIVDQTRAFHRAVALKLSTAVGGGGVSPGPDPKSLTFNHVPCVYMHPDTDSHILNPILRTYRVTRWILPIYLALYFVPALFLRTKSFLRAPGRIVLRSLLGSVRSSLFLGVFVSLFQSTFCGLHQLQDFLSRPALKKFTPEWFRNALGSAHLAWLAGFITCLSLFVDDARRRAELAAYVLPKGLESAWSVLRKRSYLPVVPGGDLLLTATGMSLVMGTYTRDPEQLSGLTRKIVYQFIGRN